MNYYCGPITVGKQTYMTADAAMYYYTLWMDDTPHYLKVYGEGCMMGPRIAIQYKGKWHTVKAQYYTYCQVEYSVDVLQALWDRDEWMIAPMLNSALAWKVNTFHTWYHKQTNNTTLKGN